MFVGRKLIVKDFSGGVSDGGERTMTIVKRRLDERQRNCFAGLPAGTGDGDDGTRRVIGLIRFHGGEAVDFGAGEGVWRRGGVVAARDQEQSVLLHGAAGGIAASRGQRASCRKSSLPRREQLRGRNGYSVRGPTDDQHIIVMRKQEGQMASARRGQRGCARSEGTSRGIKNFRGSQIHGGGAAVCVGNYVVAASDQNAAVEKRCGRVTGARRCE